MTLLPYIHKESKYNLTSSLQRLKKRLRFNDLKLWRTWEMALNSSNQLHIPKKLDIHGNVPINDLINTLNNNQDIIEMPVGTPMWIYVITIVVLEVIAIVVLVIILAIVCLFRQKLWALFTKLKNNKRSVKRGNKEVGRTEYGLVDTQENDDITSQKRK